MAMLTASAGAWPGAARRPVHAALGASPLKLAMGRSVGSPTAGHLVGGSRLPEAPYLRVLPLYAHDQVRWGLGSLVGMIDRAARKVRKAFPEAVLSVGHLSRPGGGEVDRHRSHESGRDADIGFYVRDVRGKQIFAEHLVPFRGDGTAPSWPGAYFDDARNWALVRALLTDPEARVSHIFVALPLRARLLAYAAKVGAPAEIRTRAAMTVMQPHGSLPHDDHFHVRISCPAWQRDCVEIAVRKKPALVAKVPVPRGRVRASQPPPAHAVAAADAKSAGSHAAHTTHPQSGANEATTASASSASTTSVTSATLPAASATGATGAVPPASLLVPQKDAPDDGAEAIDDVDGPI
jgi:penicillin-insensitive murein endopeptidase